MDVRSLASIIGQIISMSLALGPVTHLRTRALYSVLNQRRCWSDRLCLSVDALEELSFGGKIFRSIMLAFSWYYTHSVF